MSDFLSGLLDRTLDRAPVLDRRRPSLFEPAPETARLEALSLASLWAGGKKEAEVEQETFQMSEREPFHLRPPAPQRNREAAPMSPGFEKRNSEPLRPVKTITDAGHSETGGNRAVSQDITALPQEQRTSRDAPPATVPQEIKAVLKSVKNPAMDVGATPQVISSRRAEPKKNAEPKDDSSPLASAVKASVTPKIRLNQTSETDGQPKATLRREAEQFAIKPAKPAVQPEFPSPTRTALTWVRPQPKIAREAPHTPPTIQVVIGRVEVRSTPLTAAHARPSRAAAPKLNLDDYLRSRGGGTR
jgi:hypothetical protein